MLRENFNDLSAFMVVAQERSFTKAAARLGISQPALSQALKGLEARLGVRLLIRTTRSVSPTEAGQQLISMLRPRLSELENEIQSFVTLRDKPAGVVRISTSSHAATTIIWPKLKPVIAQYPDIKLEIVVDNGMTDIAAERFDAGVRLAEQVAKDMFAVRIGPDIRFSVVGSPEYFLHKQIPRHPKELIHHNCINIRLITSGGLYVWEFEKDDEEVKVRVDGQLVLNGGDLALDATLNSFGLGLFFSDIVEPYIQQGKLIPVLTEWSKTFSGYHLYYPSRKMSPAFDIVVNALRFDR
ncbi:LysR family transcriptional regulator [uncultured Tolumonas sp.]|uniref:LysR family transcriptional regulator n=1 Tax=uncultured Tolumonas sp. TaxID=263765 RepID=UPI00292FFF2A|nr:LysR family transcriptional regulator [uncultured Tolumonas sp.]